MVERKQSSFNTYFSAGLGRGGRIGAWVAALSAYGAYKYYEHLNKPKVFTDEDRAEWNTTKSRRN